MFLEALIIAGLVTGAVYGLAGVGLVLTYKTSGIFNFAHGAFGTLAAYTYYTVNFELGAPWWVAAIAAVFVLGPLIGLGFERFARRLSDVSLTLQIVATVGVMVLVESVFPIIFGSEQRTFPVFLSSSTIRVFGTYVTWGSVIIVAISVVATGGLYVLLRTSLLGKSMRAVVDDPHLLALTGTSPSLVRRWAWTIGATFAVLSGLLLAPSLSLDSESLTLLVLQSFGAAAIGGFSNLPLTWVGGLVIGVGTSVATGYLSSTGILGGFSPSIPFIVLILVLVLVPKRYLPVPRAPRVRRGPRPRMQPKYQIGFAIVVGVALLLGPEIAGTHLDEWTSGLTSTMLLLSLGFLVRVSGQVSLAQLGFAAIGAAAFGELMPHLGLPWLVMLVVAGLVVVPIGALLALPSTRLSGLYLALATLAFGIVLQNMFYQSSLMFTFGGSGLFINRPSLSWLSVGSDKGFYYTVLALTTVTAVGFLLLNRACWTTLHCARGSTDGAASRGHERPTAPDCRLLYCHIRGRYCRRALWDDRRARRWDELRPAAFAHLRGGGCDHDWERALVRLDRRHGARAGAGLPHLWERVVLPRGFVRDHGGDRRRSRAAAPAAVCRPDAATAYRRRRVDKRPWSWRLEPGASRSPQDRAWYSRCGNSRSISAACAPSTASA